MQLAEPSLATIGLGKGFGRWQQPFPLLFATYLAPIMEPTYQGIVQRITESLEIEGELIVGSSYDDLARGDVDVAFVCGWPYVQIAAQESSPIDLLAAPVLTTTRFGGRPLYASDVIVRRDLPFQSFADLRGRSWCFNEPRSYSGYLATLDHLCHTHSSSPFFGRVHESGLHEESIRLVAAGEIDASAIDSHVLSLALMRDPDLGASLRVLTSFRPAPIQPVVAGRHLPVEVRMAMREILLGLADDPTGAAILQSGLIRRFVAISDEAYNPIRAREAAARAAGFTRLG